LIEHERLVTGRGGLALRFGHRYGPGSSYAPDGPFVEQFLAGKVPIIGRGGAVFSFVHAHDAATAIVAALHKQFDGVLNIVDDDPTPLRIWLPELARIVGAPPPRHVPTAVARLAVGSLGVAFMTALPGADNRRARHQLDWCPDDPSWRDGFAETWSGRVTTSMGSCLRLRPSCATARWSLVSVLTLG
jgi:nucleoside-diphosphate-sugar epimerase